MTAEHQPWRVGAPAAHTSPMSNVRVIERGDLFASRAHVLVNPVNTVGVMGKGLALAFKRRYPLVFEDYQRACQKRTLAPGRPVLHQCLGCRPVISLPTKTHWRQPSTLELVVAGVRGLAPLIERHAIGSLATPALGCGLGGLDWAQSRPVLVAELDRLGIPVELYAPR